MGEEALQRSRHARAAPAPSMSRGTEESAPPPAALYPWLDEGGEAAPRTRASAAAAPFARASARAPAALDAGAQAQGGAQVQGGASAARAGGGGGGAVARLELVINTDGASRGNPGAASYGVRLLLLYYSLA